MFLSFEAKIGIPILRREPEPSCPQCPPLLPSPRDTRRRRYRPVARRCCQANAAVRAAQAAFDEADRPVRTLQAVVARAQQAEAELAELQASRQREVGAWLASGSFGERPAISHAELKAEKTVKTARADADAAARALPAVLAPRNAALAALPRPDRAVAGARRFQAAPRRQIRLGSGRGVAALGQRACSGPRESQSRDQGFEAGRRARKVGY
jgi:hypothetical protein